jgi:large subunit ribosomal protein L4
MKAATFTKTGTKATTEVTLDKSVFERESNAELLKLSYLRTLANKRLDTAKTKTRGEISGGGKKPWRQKGTGRARTSSIRNPIWRGGGTIFGPTGEQNHTINLPKKAIRSSIAQALSLKAEAKAIHVIEAFDCKEGKIRATADLLKKMELTGKTLIVVDKWDGLVERATGNLANVSASEPRFLTVNMVLDAKSIVITTAALEQLKAWLGTTGAKV